jgi:hypothetical protein
LSVRDTEEHGRNIARLPPNKCPSGPQLQLTCMCRAKGSASAKYCPPPLANVDLPSHFHTTFVTSAVRNPRKRRMKSSTHGASCSIG